MRQLVLAFLLLFTLPACRTQTPVRVAVVAVGTSLSVLHTEHQRVYREATDSLRARLRSEGADYARYQEESRSINASFQLRSDAIVAIDSALYATAAITDAVSRGAPATEYMGAARDLLLAIDRAMNLLGAQGALPSVAVPEQLRTAVRILTTISHGVAP